MFQRGMVRSTFAIRRFGCRYRGTAEAFSGASFGTQNKDPKEPSVVDSFRIFGFPHQFNISSSELKRKYHKLMTEHHPDKHREASIPEMSDEEDKAAQITNAYQTLLQPHTRASHLLELLGKPMDETSSTDLVGMEFLMTVMEVRESVDSASPEHMQPLWQETKLSMEKLMQDLTIAFDEEKDLDKAIELAAQLQYWRRIESTIHEKMNLE